MSSRNGNQEELGGDGDAQRHGDVQRLADAEKADSRDELGTKDAVVARIKHNFYLETQAFRKRILDATDEASRARERVDSFQEEMLRVKRKCYKLKKLLQERDATIQFLHEQQAVSFPIMMSETMRSIHLHMDNNNNQQQDDDVMSQTPLSISRVREQVQDRAIIDDRIHEYETQIAQLYTEIQDEKQKNEMLSECLREQKHTKAKLMKACKHARQEVEALKNNGMAQLLEDMQTKCQGLEAANERLSRELREEQLKVQEAQSRHDLMARQMELLSEAQSNWEAVVTRKDGELARLREQIQTQQVLIENMEFDRKHARARRSSFSEHNAVGGDDSDVREERELLMQALQTERSRLKDAEQEIQELRTKTEVLERSLSEALSSSALSIDNGVEARRAPAPTSSTDLSDLLQTAQQLRRKVNVLHALLSSYKKTDTIDIQLLAGESWRDNDNNAEVESLSHESSKARLRMELLHAKRSLSELQQMVEDVCATSMGSACALQ